MTTEQINPERSRMRKNILAKIRRRRARLSLEEEDPSHGMDGSLASDVEALLQEQIRDLEAELEAL